MRFYFFIILSFTTAFGNQLTDNYTLTPVTEGNNFHFTNSLVWVEDNNAKTVLNFDDQAGNCFGFFTVIENKCDSAISFEPLDIYAEVYNDENGLTEEPELLYSIDPDEQVELIDKDIKSLKSNKELKDGLNCFLAGLSVAVAAASNEVPDGYIMDDIVAEEDEYTYNKYDLEQEKIYWETEVLRSSLILPAKKAAGYFYIPISPEAKWIKVIIPFGETEYVFNFRQTKIPGPNH
jgi:hypothetical protein